MRPEHIEDVLEQLHSSRSMNDCPVTGRWFSWSDPKSKVYANLVIHGDQEKPTKEWLEAELTSQQDAWDAEQVARQAKLDSVKSKLEALGLTTEEVKEAFGI
jgi:hypothetical protein